MRYCRKNTADELQEMRDLLRVHILDLFNMMWDARDAGNEQLYKFCKSEYEMLTMIVDNGRSRATPPTTED